MKPRSVDVPIEQIRPRGDFVLVRRLPDYRSFFWVPRQNERAIQDLRIGEVLQVGPGDAAYIGWCRYCDVFTRRMLVPPVKCTYCGKALEDGVSTHANIALGVRVGDKVIYPRVPDNDITVNGEELTMLHEECHVLAVLDEQS